MIEYAVAYLQSDSRYGECSLWQLLNVRVSGVFPGLRSPPAAADRKRVVQAVIGTSP